MLDLDGTDPELLEDDIDWFDGFSTDDYCDPDEDKRDIWENMTEESTCGIPEDEDDE